MYRVLYIEDNDNNRELVRRVLIANGFEVIGASDARSGIDLAISNPPDLILMDLGMPGMDGLAATREIRQMPSIAHIPIVALSANVRQEDQDRSIEAGCDGFIGKPIDVDTLPDEINEYLR